MDGLHIILLVLYLVYLFRFGLYCFIKNKSAATPPKKCICHDVDQASPGGRCEADHSCAKLKSKRNFCLNCGKSEPFCDGKCEAHHSKNPRDVGTSFYI